MSDQLTDSVADLADAMQGIRGLIETTLTREEEERRKVSDEEYEQAWESLQDALLRRGYTASLKTLRHVLEDRDDSKTSPVSPYPLQTIAKKLWQDW